MPPRPSKFYRVIDVHPNRQKCPQEQPSPQKLTESIVRNNHFVYIDVNSDKGLCQMQSINAQEADQDIQAFGGNNYLCAVNRLPIQSQKVMDYVYKMQQLRKQKHKFKQLLKDQINATIQKYSKQKFKKKEKKKQNKISEKREAPTQNNPGVVYQPSREFKFLPRKIRSLSVVTNPQQQKKSPRAQDKNSVIIYRGMQTKYLKEYLEQKELEHINTQILQKQKLLIAKYGFTNQFSSSTKVKSPIIRRNGKILLPEIKSMPHFAL